MGIMRQPNIYIILRDNPLPEKKDVSYAEANCIGLTGPEKVSGERIIFGV
jgi:hypothetical protein